MKYGYGRVSSAAQNLTTQIKQLQEVGCDTIFKEKVSGRKNVESNLICSLNQYKKVTLLLLRS
ncbi:recombinase family protein [Bacillus thuringiensis]